MNGQRGLNLQAGAGQQAAPQGSGINPQLLAMAMKSFMPSGGQGAGTLDSGQSPMPGQSQTPGFGLNQPLVAGNQMAQPSDPSQSNQMNDPRTMALLQALQSQGRHP